MKQWKKAVALCLVIGVVMALALPVWAEEAQKVNEEAQKVNINQASAEELAQLKGIGPECAARIVEYREQHGPFVKAEDIMNVSGIGPKTFEENKDLITVK
jgi:competence ComEA-like helix-hairpin-helix protein